MNNKKILSKLVKIASNQQVILNKLAQTNIGSNNESDNAMNDFIKYQFTSWAMPKEIEGKSSHTASRENNSNHYNVDVYISLSNPNQKSIVEDPVNGFSAWLTKKFATASKVERWKNLEGCTATFKVTTN